MSPAPIPGFESKSTMVGGVRLHYWTGGDPTGQPVILWHGFLSTAYAWRDVGPALAKSGLAVLIPDMRGYGDSDKPAGNGGYDARALAEEGRALIAAIGFGPGKQLIHAAHDMGALPALIWTADHPDEVAGLLYIEAPVMLGSVLQKVFSYTPQAMASGSMWWWILPLAPGVPERMIVGNERAFLTWFYEGENVVNHGAFTPEAVDEYLRTFAGKDGVLGSMGIYRTAFTSIAQTEPLMAAKIAAPVIALGGEKGLGDKVGEMVAMIAESVEAHTLAGCGHFMPEERPEFIIGHILSLSARVAAARGDGDSMSTDLSATTNTTHHSEHLADRVAMLAMRTMIALQPKADLGPTGRAAFNELMDKTPSAEGVIYEAATVGGVPGWWCRPDGANVGHAILYLHGGAYIVGSARAYRHFAGQFASRANASAFVADYGLAPERPFPAAVEDAEAAYRGLASAGFSRIAVVGDSAGGGLALVMAAQMAQAARELVALRPVAVCVMSPWTDLALSGDSIESRAKHDPLLSRDALEVARQLYLGQADSKDPRVSPMYGDLMGLPPILLHVGEDEILLDDARRYADLLAKSGSEAELHIWQGMAHVFPANLALLKAAGEALDIAGEFLRRYLVPSTSLRSLGEFPINPTQMENRMTKILYVGQKPETVDFSDPALPPGTTAEKINAGIALGVKKIEEHGWKGDTCMITPDAAGSAMLEKALTGAGYDCVVIGGGMRLPPKGLVLFETVINIIHKSAPNATIAFNTKPEDTADAAARQVKAA